MDTETIFDSYVGKIVRKKSNKPFKSGLKENTVKALIEHPITKRPAFTFVEDETYVECRMCTKVNRKPEYIIMGIMMLICIGMIVYKIISHYTN